MDLLEGETLAARIARGRLSLPETAGILVHVASVAGAAHALGIVHRDLKPENIFLTHDADPLSRVRVLDFGIAKLARGEPDTELTTRTGAVVGTPCYMAPEQAFGERDLDHRVDLWALGVIAYEALTGGRPVEADNLGQFIKRLLSDAIVPLEEIVPDIPADVAALISRLLARDRGDRPVGVDEVVEVFGRHTNGALLTASKVRRHAAAAAPRRAGRVALLTASSVAVATLAWVVFGAERPAAPATPLSSNTIDAPPALAESTASVLAAATTVASAPPPSQPVSAPTHSPAAPQAVRPGARPARRPAPSASASPPPPIPSRPGLVTEPPY
jgi:serine/threonine-protein kinase